MRTNIIRPTSRGYDAVSIADILANEYRILCLDNEVTAEKAQEIIMQLIIYYLIDPNKPIFLIISGPGGGVDWGLMIIDTMNAISCPIYTICTGLAASMDALLLAAGDKGRRFILPHSRVMVHEPLIPGGVGGSANTLTALFGASGAGKSENIKNTLSVFNNGSPIVLDQKGRFYGEFAEDFRERGFKTVLINVTDPANSDRYNPFGIIKDYEGCIKTSDLMVRLTDKDSGGVNNFDSNAKRLLFTLVLAALLEGINDFKLNPFFFIRVLNMFQPEDMEKKEKSRIYRFFTAHDDAYREKTGERSWAVEQFRKFMALGKDTAGYIILNVQASVAVFDSKEMRKMTFKSDFGTTTKIHNFTNMISNMRSRAISVIIAIQAISQLEDCYGKTWTTIVNNCDNIVNMGGNDPITAEYFSKLFNVPTEKITEMPLKHHYIKQRGKPPRYGKSKYFIDYYKIGEQCAESD